MGFFWYGLHLIGIGTYFNYLYHESVESSKMQTQFFKYPCTYSRYAASLIPVLKDLMQSIFHSRKYDSQC